MTTQRLYLARHLMSRLAQRTRKGFTLIELLVVVVIIGILASVALPSFVGAQDKARNASVQSNARTVQMALEEYSTEHNGAYPSTTWTSSLTGSGVTYLPGGYCPRSPWAVAGATGQAEPVGVTGNATAGSSVAAGNPNNMFKVSTTFSAASGALPPTSGTWTSANYGAILYDYDTNTQYYVLYAAGKMGKGTVCVSSISNAGN
jgi:prepilin-type N-terminal cleavage/methylation domain-containing protein